MNAITIKEEISQIINHLPEPVLAEVLDYLRQVDTKPVSTVDRNQLLQQILREDRDVLTRLA